MELAPPPSLELDDLDARTGGRMTLAIARPFRSSRAAASSGLAFGAMHGGRRGSGSDVAGSRPYVPGDDPDTIDWAASARASPRRGARTSSSSASTSPTRRRGS